MDKGETSTLRVDFGHVMSYDIELADAIKSHYYRFEPFLRDAVGQLMRKHFPKKQPSSDERTEYYLSFYNLSGVLKFVLCLFH